MPHWCLSMHTIQSADLPAFLFLSFVFAAAVFHSACFLKCRTFAYICLYFAWIWQTPFKTIILSLYNNIMGCMFNHQKLMLSLSATLYLCLLCLFVWQLALLKPIHNPALELAIVMLIVPFFVNVSLPLSYLSSLFCLNFTSPAKPILHV